MVWTSGGNAVDRDGIAIVVDHVVIAGQQPVEDGRERPDVPATSMRKAPRFIARDGRDKPGHDWQKREHHGGRTVDNRCMAVRA
jgi:hypothetical protein